MYLKAYANHMKGSKLWQPLTFSVITFLKYIPVQAEISLMYKWGSADTGLAKIHYKMSELFDKEVNAQKEFEKLPEFMQSPVSP